MQRRVIFFLLILFVVFLMTTDESGTGETAKSFFDWVGGGLDKTRDFVDALRSESDVASVEVDPGN
jgi:hypothetical protein